MRRNREKWERKSGKMEEVQKKKKKCLERCKVREKSKEEDINEEKRKWKGDERVGDDNEGREKIVDKLKIEYDKKVTDPIFICFHIHTLHSLASLFSLSFTPLRLCLCLVSVALVYLAGNV